MMEINGFDLENINECLFCGETIPDEVYLCAECNSLYELVTFLMEAVQDEALDCST